MILCVSHFVEVTEAEILLINVNFFNEGLKYEMVFYIAKKKVYLLSYSA